MTRFNYLDVVSTLGLLSFDENGVLQGAYPVSPTKNDIRIAVDGVGSGYAMCAIDALGVPFFFSAKTVIESADRATNERMLITIDPASPDTDAYAEIVISVPKAMPTKNQANRSNPPRTYVRSLGSSRARTPCRRTNTTCSISSRLRMRSRTEGEFSIWRG